jgi:hypothetical protein
MGYRKKFLKYQNEKVRGGHLFVGMFMEVVIYQHSSARSACLMSVHSSTMYMYVLLFQMDTGVFFLWKTLEKIHITLETDKNIGHFMWWPKYVRLWDDASSL